MDLATILKAIALVNDIAPAVARLYEGFIENTQGADQHELKLRYAAARLESDALAERMTEQFGG